MSNFFKAIIITLTCAVIVTTFVGQREYVANKENDVAQEVEEFENNIDSGLIINDGYLDDDRVEIKKDDANIVSTVTSKIGDGVTSLIGKILKFFANLISKLLN